MKPRGQGPHFTWVPLLLTRPSYEQLKNQVVRRPPVLERNISDCTSDWFSTPGLSRILAQRSGSISHFWQTPSINTQVYGTCIRSAPLDRAKVFVPKMWLDPPKRVVVPETTLTGLTGFSESAVKANPAHDLSDLYVRVWLIQASSLRWGGVFPCLTAGAARRRSQHAEQQL